MKAGDYYWIAGTGPGRIEEVYPNGTILMRMGAGKYWASPHELVRPMTQEIWDTFKSDSSVRKLWTEALENAYQEWKSTCVTKSP